MMLAATLFRVEGIRALQELLDLFFFNASSTQERSLFSGSRCAVWHVPIPHRHDCRVRYTPKYGLVDVQIELSVQRAAQCTDEHRQQFTVRTEDQALLEPQVTVVPMWRPSGHFRITVFLAREDINIFYDDGLRSP